MDPLGILITTLTYLGFILLGLVCFMFIAIIILVIMVRHTLDKLMFGLKWMTWYTLEEIVIEGYSKFWSMLVLPILHQKKYLEIQTRDDLSEEQRETCADEGFTFMTVKLHQFRLSRRKGPKRKWGPQNWEFPVLKPVFS